MDTEKRGGLRPSQITVSSSAKFFAGCVGFCTNEKRNLRAKSIYSDSPACFTFIAAVAR